jgi:uncharacterized protein (TIGR02594 family)
VIWRWTNQSAFGEHAPQADPDNNGRAYTLNLRFPGQYYDSESGLYYNGHRYLDPATGRYLESDPIGLAGGMSTYGYANQDPLRFIDPLGLYGFGLNQRFNETSTLHQSLENGEGYFEAQTPWLDTAKGEVGQAEVPGAGSNPRISEYWDTVDGVGPGREDTGGTNAWCAAFMNWDLGRVGIRGTGRGNAVSYESWGQRLPESAIGAIAVHRNPNGTGHVAFVVGYLGNGRIVVLGGNQGDAVRYTDYPANYFQQFHYPTGWTPNYNVPTVTIPTTSGGSTR